MKKILGILAGAALVAAAPAHATNGMRMIGFGPIQNGMGGASVAAPLDSATVVTNPAGLSALSPRIDIAGQSFAPSVKYKADWATPGPSGSASQSSGRPTDFLPTLAGVYRVDEQVTLGLAALGTAGMGVDYGAGASSLFGGTTMSSYLNGRVAPAAAYRVNDRLSVGLALNLMYAQMEFNVMQPTGQAKFPSASSLGYGATVGITFRPSDEVTLGAAYETRSFFQDFEFTVGGQKRKLAFDQPMVATVGAGVRPVEGLLLAFDGEWINWSDIAGNNLPKFTSPPGAGGFNMNWNDQIVVKLGAEYQLPVLKALKVRAGYNHGKAPVDKSSAFEAVLFPAIAEHHFTVGAGYELSKLAVNVAFVYSPEAIMKGSNPAQGIVGYETKMSQTAFEFGAAYKF
jgi:long-chain fatty acid transport protein